MARYIILPPRGTRAVGFDQRSVLIDAFGVNRSINPPLQRDFSEIFSAAAPNFSRWMSRSALGGADDDTFGGGEDSGAVFSAAPFSGGVPDMQLIDSAREDGAKLVEIDDASADILARSATEVRILPLIEYDYDVAPSIKPIALPPSAVGTLSLHVVCGETGRPIAAVTVTLLTDISLRIGHEAITDDAGLVVLNVGSGPVTAELLNLAAPGAGHWGRFERDRMLRDGDEIRLDPLDPMLDPVAALRAPTAASPAGAGVKIAVVDSGVGPHPDILVTGALNTVTGESGGDVQDNGVGHGTHIAGTIAGRGKLFRGVAPAAAIQNYRVGGANGEKPTSWSILKAMDRAADNGCDIINLSLSTDADDNAVREAIRDINLRGCVVVAAAGNGWRDAIAEPARFDEVIAVSAYGDTKLFPAVSDAARFVGEPANPEKPNEFFAAFSNMGNAAASMSLIAPGVGIISLSIGGGYRVMHGTSMATAIVSAQIATLLSQQPEILAMPRDHARSVAIRQLAFSHAKRRGFGMVYEGYGGL